MLVIKKIIKKRNKQKMPFSEISNKKDTQKLIKKYMIKKYIKLEDLLTDLINLLLFFL